MDKIKEVGRTTVTFRATNTRSGKPDLDWRQCTSRGKSLPWPLEIAQSRALDQPRHNAPLTPVCLQFYRNSRSSVWNPKPTLRALRRLRAKSGNSRTSSLNATPTSRTLKTSFPCFRWISTEARRELRRYVELTCSWVEDMGNFAEGNIPAQAVANLFLLQREGLPPCALGIVGIVKGSRWAL